VLTTTTVVAVDGVVGTGEALGSRGVSLGAGSVAVASSGDGLGLTATAVAACVAASVADAASVMLSEFLGEEIAKRGARQLRAHGLAAVCAHRQLFAVMQVLPPDPGLHAAHGLKAGHDQRRIAWLVGGTGNEFDAGPRPAQGRHTGRAIDQQGAAA
jgi:hypothetical protein